MHLLLNLVVTGLVDQFLREYLEKSWYDFHSPPYWEILKIRNTDLQFTSPGHGWQKNKKKKNTGNSKTLNVLRHGNKL